MYLRNNAQISETPNKKSTTADISDNFELIIKNIYNNGCGFCRNEHRSWSTLQVLFYN